MIQLEINPKIEFLYVYLIDIQVGSFFVRQYYQVLQQQPDCAHQFYTDASTMIRVDGELSDTASALLVINLCFVFS